MGTVYSREDMAWFNWLVKEYLVYWLRRARFQDAADRVAALQSMRCYLDLRSVSRRVNGACEELHIAAVEERREGTCAPGTTWLDLHCEAWEDEGFRSTWARLRERGKTEHDSGSLRLLLAVGRGLSLAVFHAAHRGTPSYRRGCLPSCRRSPSPWPTVNHRGAQLAEWSV